MDYLDHMCTDEIVCPYCGYKHTDCEEVFETAYNDFTDYQCESCLKEFSVSRRVEVYYSSYKLKEE